MNAKEARQRALSILQGKSKSQYDKVKRSIDLAVEKGNFSINYYDELTHAVQNNLLEEGFEVTRCWDQKDGVLFLIKW